MSLETVKGRVICSVDLDSKDSHKFADGTVIYRRRRYNNLNVRETNPVNGIVISSGYIPKGAEILFHPNEIHDSNKIFNYKKLSGDEVASSVKYYSVHEEQCFIWREKDSDEWKPLNGFATGLRVFKPYSGLISGIEPTKIENVLYITSGELKGKIVNTLRACDYEIVFQDVTGREGRVIRLRHYENEIHDREEIIAVNNELTEMFENGKLLIGLSTSDCKYVSCETINQN